jgi:hypothetical protein
VRGIPVCRFIPIAEYDRRERCVALEDTVDLKLTNKVALVTGSTAGIGFATA